MLAASRCGQRTPSGRRCRRTSSKPRATSISDGRFTRAGTGGTGVGGRTPPRPLGARLGTRAPTTPKLDKSAENLPEAHGKKSLLRPARAVVARALPAAGWSLGGTSGGPPARGAVDQDG